MLTLLKSGNTRSGMGGDSYGVNIEASFNLSSVLTLLKSGNTRSGMGGDSYGVCLCHYFHLLSYPLINFSVRQSIWNGK